MVDVSGVCLVCVFRVLSPRETCSTARSRPKMPNRRTKLYANGREGNKYDGTWTWPGKPGLTFFDTSADVTVTGGVPVENGGILLSTSTIQCVMKKTRYDASHALKSPKPTGAHMLKVIARMRKAPLAPTSTHSRARAASARARACDDVLE